jgi:hypothetical protein
VRSALHIRPRVLTDAGLPRSNIAYMTAQGAVCVGHFATISVVVRADGSVVPGRARGRSRSPASCRSMATVWWHGASVARTGVQRSRGM